MPSKKIKANEDFIYIRNGKITDTSYANLVFSDGIKLFTPANTLLEGTKRALYLKQGKIQEEEISVKDLRRFNYFLLLMP
ncbi:MAG: hypothetical protein HC905_06655 [Bacteroidales bacterium]|nr:hypothetical protein [Bacteroidales bacterium]